MTQKAVTPFAGTTEGQILRGLAPQDPPVRSNTSLRPPFILLVNHLMNPPDRRQRFGFTLIELLVTVRLLQFGDPAAGALSHLLRSYGSFSTAKLAGAIDVAFYDGHVESVKLERLWSLYWQKNYVPPAKRPALK